MNSGDRMTGSSAGSSAKQQSQIIRILYSYRIQVHYLGVQQNNKAKLPQQCGETLYTQSRNDACKPNMKNNSNYK
jgi:hypothetical protein